MTAFRTAYDAVLSQWPDGTTSADVPTAYGRTRVHRSGPSGARPLVLLHGGGATSTSWFSVVRSLNDACRVTAPDLPGDPGLSVADGAPLKRADDLHAWLDTVLDGVPSPVLGGHSFGGWIALTYALARPGRLSGLVLLEPSSCFAPMRPAYLARGIPVLLRNSPARTSALFRWETGGRALDPAWLELMRVSATQRWKLPIAPRRPSVTDLRRLDVPALVVAGGRSRSQDPARMVRVASESLPRVTTHTVPGASHHTIPTEDADVLANHIRDFLA